MVNMYVQFQEQKEDEMRTRNLEQVDDLIDQNTRSWKPVLVKTLYPAPVCNEILSIPLSKTGVVSDQLMWKFSSSGDYNVHQAYQALRQDAKQHLPASHLPFSPPRMCGTQFGRGIVNVGLCPLCDSDEDSSTHLFLNCSFSRACWYGSQLAIQSSEIGSVSVQQWISRLDHNSLEEGDTRYLQLVFTLIWSIWNHRNKVMCEGLKPDPLNVILTSQALFCGYHEAFANYNNADRRNGTHQAQNQRLVGQWDLIIKIAGVRKKQVRRSAYSYEAQNIQGNIVFRGCHSSAAKSAYGALLEALVEAAVLARRYGFSHILALSSSKRLVQQFNGDSSPTWQERTFFADMCSLKQLGLVFKHLFVPSFVVNNVIA
ncbi:uncharacterized protein LOC142635829 [Castanea sativa]|uniref:uncharacterized protein LOC142635829 n=1 Tax=Castanea sativa TaxID=21020 RepID=UPI003F64D434